jgi:hypothetical protein
MKRLTIPEDDTAPNSPLQILLKRDIETANPDLALSTDTLGFRQFGGPFGEEELVAPLLATSSVLL